MKKLMSYLKKNHLARAVLCVAMACLAPASASAATADEPPRETLLEANAAKDVMAAFARCDTSFFTLLESRPRLLGPDVKMFIRGDAAAPAVQDPLVEAGQLQTFAKPVNASGLRLLAWRNEVSQDVSLGALLFWGFDVEGNPDAVAQMVNRIVEPGQRLSKLGTDWARPEFRRVDDPIDQWRRGGQAGTVTKKGEVERVLLIQAHEIPGQAKLYCTLQGSVSATLIERTRPDLSPSLFP